MVFKNALSWFEIPTKDLGRAQRFYEAIFNIQMTPLETPQIKMRLFPLEDPMGVGGAIVLNDSFYKPSNSEGPLIYLNGNPDVQGVLDRVEKAGGKILVPKTMISPEHGYMAMLLDTEGNRIALHSIPKK
ncbi:MAG: VOC family protein [Cytophagales bacterium]|nr:VOC family protein [Cytophagales bacterium]